MDNRLLSGYNGPWKMLPLESDWRPGLASPAQTKLASSALAGRGTTQATHEQGPSSLSLSVSAKTIKLVATIETAFTCCQKNIATKLCNFNQSVAAVVDHKGDQLLPSIRLQNDKNQGKKGFKKQASLPKVSPGLSSTGPPHLLH